MTRLILLMLFLNLNISCQSFEDGWRGIKPLVTTRDAVEAQLGPGENRSEEESAYKETSVVIKYIVSPCDQNGLNRPAGTVLSYNVALDPVARLDSMKIQISKYQKDKSGDTASFAYLNSKDGITIIAQEQEGVEYVTGFMFSPEKKLKEESSCKK